MVNTTNHPIKHGHASRGKLSKEYRTWLNMVQRCTNRKIKEYRHYGGRGITVCERWMIFKNFLEDMGIATSNKHSIDRVDNSKGYEPGNCRWATQQDQMRNMRRNRMITAFGETLPLCAWAEKSGIESAIIRGRIDKYGWSTERAVSETTVRARSSSGKFARRE